MEGDPLGGCISFLVPLIVVGVTAEILYNVSPRASYLFVLLVIMGYAATGSHLEKVTEFFRGIKAV